MKHLRPFLFCSGIALLLTSAMANATLIPERFAPIAVRNIFGLRPLHPKPIEAALLPNRPQIMLQGITTILGHTQALLTIQLPSASPGLFQTSCVLTTGESRYDVVVLEINEKTGAVRLDNVGMEQVLVLKR
jgi:hypothetical protein